MKKAVAAADSDGTTLSHFGPEGNLLGKLEELFVEYGESGTGQTRHFVHNEVEAEQYGPAAGTFTDWEGVARGTDLLFYEGLHGGGVVDDIDIDIARHVDLLTWAISCSLPSGDMTDAQAALAALEACGHELLSVEELTLQAQSRGPSAAFSRLELLAWRGVDDEQDRFAQALTIGDHRGMTDAVSSAAKFLALIGLLTGRPEEDGIVRFRLSGD